MRGKGNNNLPAWLGAQHTASASYRFVPMVRASNNALPGGVFVYFAIPIARHYASNA